jgi:hypothetical protein
MKRYRFPALAVAASPAVPLPEIVEQKDDARKGEKAICGRSRREDASWR